MLFLYCCKLTLVVLPMNYALERFNQNWIFIGSI